MYPRRGRDTQTVGNHLCSAPGYKLGFFLKKKKNEIMTQRVRLSLPYLITSTSYLEAPISAKMAILRQERRMC